MNNYIVRRWVSYPEFLTIKASSPHEARDLANRKVRKRHPHADINPLECVVAVKATAEDVFGTTVLQKWEE